MKITKRQLRRIIREESYASRARGRYAPNKKVAMLSILFKEILDETAKSAVLHGEEPDEAETMAEEALMLTLAEALKSIGQTSLSNEIYASLGM